MSLKVQRVERLRARLSSHGLVMVTPPYGCRRLANFAIISGPSLGHYCIAIGWHGADTIHAGLLHKLRVDPVHHDDTTTPLADVSNNSRLVFPPLRGDTFRIAEHDADPRDQLSALIARIQAVVDCISDGHLSRKRLAARLG